MTFTQTEFDIRLEWGEHGVSLLVPISDVVIIVDVLSFTTCVEIATNRKAIIYPFRGKQETAQEFARSVSAELAQKRGDAKYPLSQVDVGDSGRHQDCSAFAQWFHIDAGNR